MPLCGAFPPIPCGFGARRVVCVRYNLNRLHFHQIAFVESVTISFTQMFCHPQ
ncbi:MAG: hypothetical protein K0Q63_3856 [Paenibacillus sp.]|nr:hypothetical protein [Paenibacillus sp.]